MKVNNREFVIILYTLEIQKNIQIEDSLILTMDLKVALTGLVL